MSWKPVHNCNLFFSPNTHTCHIVGIVSVTIRQGFPVLAVPLPSRNESCDFILRPHLQTVGDFVNHVKAEDGGVDRYVHLIASFCGF